MAEKTTTTTFLKFLLIYKLFSYVKSRIAICNFSSSVAWLSEPYLVWPTCLMHIYVIFSHVIIIVIVLLHALIAIAIMLS